MKAELFDNINEISKEIYEANKAKGFWDKERNIGELLMLVTSELAEALEAHRKSKSADLTAFKSDLYFADIIDFDFKEDDRQFYQIVFKNHIKDSFEDEIADAVIRLFDMAGGLNIDLSNHIKAKLKYNESRQNLHGKKY